MDWDLILTCLARLVLAVVLGFGIGFERKLRFKEAGIRTHTIVCMGSCLYMLISLFAFKGADTSRVAAQIVSGIGFIGAGMIFYHKEVVHGLTTAAGIWATAAIGMTAGAGWYVIALVATALVILVQCIMHLNIPIFHSKRFVKINIVFTDEHGQVSEHIKEIFKVKRFTRISAKRENESIIYSVVISTDKIIMAGEITKLLLDNPEIKSIVRQDDDF